MYQNSRLRSYPSKVKKRRLPKGLLLVTVIVVLAVAAGAFFSTHQRKNSDDPQDKSANNTPAFNKQQYSLTDPTSPWVVVNKKRPLNPKQYEPADLQTPGVPLDSAIQLRNEAALALETLVADAKASDIDLMLLSGYRSYSLQATIYDSEVKGYGQTQADRESARPGHSEHQTGWAADLGAANGKCRILACFGDTPEGKWLAANAHSYGFILRYTPDKEPITGYNYEPWHIRYIGIDLAAEMHRTNVKTLEEFFDLPAAPSY